MAAYGHTDPLSLICMNKRWSKLARHTVQRSKSCLGKHHQGMYALAQVMEEGVEDDLSASPA